MKSAERALGVGIFVWAFVLAACDDTQDETRLTRDVAVCEDRSCQNGGSCSDDVGNPTCACPAGFAGDHCERNLDECAAQPCQNGGTCSDGVNGYSCACAPGFSGSACVADIDECAGNPCRNGGACSDAVNGYSCSCAGGFSGEECIADIDECDAEPCQNDGICSDVINGYSCACATGFSGAGCATNIDECASQPCLNGGSCDDGIDGYTCNCAAGFTGADCDVDVDECASQPCLNGGSCDDGIDGYTCSCAAGFTGAECDVNVDECASEPCLNGGSCADGINGYTCGCAAGFAGADCDVNVDDCASEPCLNGGSCDDGIDAYTCDCTGGFSGLNCQTPNVDECTANSDNCDANATCTDIPGTFECTCNAPYDGDGTACATSALSNLRLSTGTFDEPFQPTLASYGKTVACEVATAYVVPTAMASNATLEIRVRNGGGAFLSYAAVISGAVANGVPLAPGANTIEVRVAVAGAATRSYDITITRSGDGLECGLIGLYAFEEGALDSAPSGSDFADQSGNSMHLTAVGAVSPVALGFDGASTAISLPGTPGVYVANGVTLNHPSITFSFWMKAAALPSAGLLAFPLGIAQGGQGASLYDKDVLLGSTGKLELYVYDGGGRYTPESTTGMVVGTWYHVVAIADGTKSYLYINGILEGTVTSAGTFTGYSAPGLILGGTTGGAPVAFNGAIDELGVWSRGLNEVEVAELYGADAFGFCELVSGSPDCACGTGFHGVNVVCQAD